MNIIPEYKIDFIFSNILLPESNSHFRIIYVLEGKCDIQSEGRNIPMGKMDIFSVNVNEACRLNGMNGAIVAVLEIDYYMFCSLLKVGRTKIAVNSYDDTGYKYIELREDIQTLLLTYVENKASDFYRRLEVYYRVLDCLVTHFLLKDEYYKDRSEDARIVSLVQYIHTHYKEDISLSEISNQLYMSISTASRLFQKHMGENFASYVKRIRIDHAKKQLLQPDISIVKIAVDNGFSTASAMNKVFKAEIGMTPSQYRNEHMLRKKETFRIEDKEWVMRVLQENGKSLAHGNEQIIHIKADIEKVTHVRTKKGLVLNAGPVHALRSAEMQRQILLLAMRLKVEYVRVWNLLSTQVFQFQQEQGKYNYAYIDEVMDFCVDNNLKIFFDLAPRHDVIMKNEKEELYIDENSQYVNEPEWEAALQRLLIHFVTRYGQDIVEAWIFEFTFFLSDLPYFKAEHYSMLKVWEKGYSLIKQIIPSVRIAGPGIAVGKDVEQLEPLIGKFLTGKYKPDIFTTINFPYSLKGKTNNNTIIGRQYDKIPSRRFLGEQIDSVKKILSKYEFDGEYWITEWGNSVASRSFIQDSCFRGAFIVENVLLNRNKVDAMGLYFATDLMSTHFDSDAVLFGSAGLLSKDGIRKPAYYAFRFLSRLGRNSILQDEGCLITMENSADIRILCYNSKALGANYYFMADDSYQPDEVNRLFANRDRQVMELDLRMPVQEGYYAVCHRIMNETKGSVLNTWIESGCPDTITKENVEYLVNTCIPEFVLEKKEVMDHILHMQFPLEPNEIRLITIMPE